VEDCNKCYSLGQNGSTDEKLEAFRRRCSFKLYIPSNPNKNGIKIYTLVDAKVLYTCNLEIYAGRQPDFLYQATNKPANVTKGW
jgi:hypothetical protein